MTLQQIIEDLGYETRSYSGRGMYGKSCLGVSLDAEEKPFKILADVFEYLLDDMGGIQETEKKAITKAFRQAQTDSLGLGTILYFPRVEYLEE